MKWGCSASKRTGLPKVAGPLSLGQCCCSYRLTYETWIAGGVDLCGQSRGSEGSGLEADGGIGAAGNDLLNDAGASADDLVVAVAEDSVDRVDAGANHRSSGNGAADVDAIDGSRGEGVVDI